MKRVPNPNFARNANSNYFMFINFFSDKDKDKKLTKKPRKFQQERNFL